MDQIKDLPIPTRSTAPFVYDVGSRVAKGALTGWVIGLLFFKRKGMRRFCLYYGAGFGLGMSYNQISHIFYRLTGNDKTK